MKAVYLIFCLVLFSLSNCNGKDIDSPGPAVIMGTIENHDPDDQLLYYTYLTGQPVKIINGQYKIELDIQEPSLISLKYNKMVPWDIYVKPGDSIRVAFERFDWLNFYTSLQYAGDRAQANTRLFQLNQLLNEGFMDRGFFRMEASVFTNQLLALKQKSDHLIATWEKEKEPDKAFIQFVRQLRDYTLAYYACIYPSQISVATGAPYGPATDALSGMMVPPRMDDKYLHQPILGSYILERLDYHFRLQNSPGRSDKLSRKLQLIDSLYTDPFFNEYARFQMLNEQMRSSGIDQALEKAYKYFVTVAQNEAYKKTLSDWYENSNLIQEGRAPDFSFVDAENRPFKLSQLNSTYVYIDVWATWCGPCLQERPAFERLMDDLKDRSDITFLSISLDENEERWRDMVKKKEMKGIHLLAEGAFQSPFAKAFQIAGIPRFILLGKDRRVLDSNAPRPSQEGVEQIFEGGDPSKD
jgi:thiol-disulfide isomerase/thioredoxin